MPYKRSSRVGGWPTFGLRESAPAVNAGRVTTGGAPRLAIFGTWVYWLHAANPLSAIDFSSQSSMTAVTDIPVAMPENRNRNKIGLAKAEVSPSPEMEPRCPHTPLPVLIDNLGRLPGVSGAGARWRNPERSEESGTLRRLVGRDPERSRTEAIPPPKSWARRKARRSQLSPYSRIFSI